MRKFILDTAPGDFNHSNSYRVEAQDSFINDSVMAGNKISLMILIRSTFEMSIYDILMTSTLFFMINFVPSATSTGGLSGSMIERMQITINFK
jgi:hypothetical protein